MLLQTLLVPGDRGLHCTKVAVGLLRWPSPSNIGQKVAEAADKSHQFLSHTGATSNRAARQLP